MFGEVFEVMYAEHSCIYFDLLLYFTQSCQTVSLAQHNQHDRVFYILYPPDPSMCILYVCFALLNHNCVQLVLLEYMNYSCLNTHKNCFIRIFLGNTSYLPTVTCMPFWQYNLFNWPVLAVAFVLRNVNDVGHCVLRVACSTLEIYH